MRRSSGALSSISLATTLVGWGCVHQPRPMTEFDRLIPKEQQQLEVETRLDEVQPEADESTRDVGTEISSGPETPSRGAIPIALNEAVERKIALFTGRLRRDFQTYMQRGERFRPSILKVLNDHGLPSELYYLAMIESGFKVTAYSHAGAAGVWQFIPGTAERYGLRVNRVVDERRDPLRATLAAALYLRDLHNVFGSWYLAMAAYNAGERRIMNSIMRANTRDFWELVEKRALPRETMNYIPKFLAATVIGHNPEKYGFRRPRPTPLPPLKAVPIPTRVPLRRVAQAIDLPYTTLKEYNPHLRRGITPSGRDDYKVWVPEQNEAKLRLAYNDLKKHRLRGGAIAIHRVRRGDTLSSISRRYGVSIRQLRALNGIRGSRILVGQKLRVAGKGGTLKLHKYKVRRGDNLIRIARRFGTSVKRIKSLNRLRRSRIYAGQVLKVDRG